MKKTIKVLLILLIVLAIFGGMKSFATEPEPQIQWTDFSNAEFKVQRNGRNTVELSISNVEFNEDHYYKYLITSSEKEPQFDEFEFMSVDYPIDITKSVVLNQDLYFWVLESYKTNDNLSVKAKKIDRPVYLEYANAFHDSFISDSANVIAFNLPIDSVNKRTINLKIGEISDNSLLKKIANNENGAWDLLLNYAKKSTNIYNKEITLKNSIANDENLKNLSIKDGKYYFVYVEFDDENGKYYPINNIVTIGQGRVIGDLSWNVYFYGNDNFKWKLEEEKEPEVVPETEPETKPETQPAEKVETKPEDDTTVTGSIPYTGGMTVVILSMVIIAVIGAIAYIKNKDLRGI